MIIELRMCDEDRAVLGGPEWVQLDTERVMDTPAKDLIRWEAECAYPIEQAIRDIRDSRPPAASTLVLLWLARKQGGDLAGGVDEATGQPERYARLMSVRTLRVATRAAVQPEPAPEAEVDAIPPESTPAP
ncbi:hypothetical protein O7626_00535 [Micromonospora sp. WMMD1102]|uniref:hypothetical protein n=1 Tax=Micromonospora sp. WMMD1102 TaxID=3016105 RepID=UPI0024152E74|nr:hypothetical protein [Micromonospora sp. WMMD1102]MDG4784433.1 hypothetical protein [Micromonospora sp. WMMD1102]